MPAETAAQPGKVRSSWIAWPKVITEGKSPRRSCLSVPVQPTIDGIQLDVSSKRSVLPNPPQQKPVQPSTPTHHAGTQSAHWRQAIALQVRIMPEEQLQLK